MQSCRRIVVSPDELARVDAVLDDPVFFAPFVPFFDARIGRPSIPMDLSADDVLEVPLPPGFDALCREVGDSISWQRFAPDPFGTRVPHPTTMMKL
jgi:transposase, IS5 family